jgi:hypothetical protein
VGKWEGAGVGDADGTEGKVEETKRLCYAATVNFMVWVQ